MAQNVILRISKKITEIEDLLHVREHVGQILEAFASRCTTLTLYTSRYTDTWFPICTGYHGTGPRTTSVGKHSTGNSGASWATRMDTGSTPRTWAIRPRSRSLPDACSASHRWPPW